MRQCSPPAMEGDEMRLEEPARAANAPFHCGAHVSHRTSPGAETTAAYTLEKSTNQLSVWWELIEALERVDAAWQRTLEAEAQAKNSWQVPCHVAARLARIKTPVGRILNSVSDVLAQQHATGWAFHSDVEGQRQVNNSAIIDNRTGAINDGERRIDHVDRRSLA